MGRKSEKLPKEKIRAFVKHFPRGEAAIARPSIPTNGQQADKTFQRKMFHAAATVRTKRETLH
jgi:hypothetical protein